MSTRHRPCMRIERTLVHISRSISSFHNSLRFTHIHNNHSAFSFHLHTITTTNKSTVSNTMSTGVWSREEHDKFLDAIQKYPQGPWRLITECIGTRSLRQVQTHAQKYHEKIVRHMRGLRKDRRNAVERGEHRIDDATLEACKVGEGFRLISPSRLQPRSPTLEIEQQVSTEARSSQLQDAPELPSLDESLDFLIEYLSAEVLSSDEDLEFDLGDIC